MYERRCGKLRAKSAEEVVLIIRRCEVVALDCDEGREIELSDGRRDGDNVRRYRAVVKGEKCGEAGCLAAVEA